MRSRESEVARASEDALLARLAPPALLTALACDALSHARTLTCFAFFPTDVREKERLLAVYCDTGAVLYQLSDQANWELVTF